LENDNKKQNKDVFVKCGLGVLCSFFLVFLVGVPSVYGSKSEQSVWSEGLKSRIDYLIKRSGISRSHLSIWVSTESFADQLQVYDLNSQSKRVPASLTKVITGAAALRLYPENHKFVTRLMSPHPIKNGVLKGDLYLVGGGNPSFVSENMWDLVNELRRTGVKKIEGQVIVDDSLFDSVRFDPSRTQQRVNRAYDAPVGAMSFNWNSVNVYIRPGSSKGKPASVYIDPENEYYELVNNVTTSGGASASVQLKRVPVGKNKERITVSGKIGLSSDEKVKYMSVLRPDYWSGFNLISFLKQRGIEVQEKVKLGKVPGKSRVLSDHESKPLSEVVKDMMKFSNNYVAEMLTKNLSLMGASKERGTMEGGMHRLQKFLTERGWKASDFALVNPSGLTRDNRFSAFAMASLLDDLRDEFKIYPEFLTSFPVSGVDGTLKKRLVGESTKGWMRAKTGMLTGVIGLAGFVKSKKRPLFTYVFIFNGKGSQTIRARELSDEIAYSLINES
tara:strand:+ start:126922 stop:128427 length:1506 start_codon:yes stop_codon:yes gene_type:complete